MRSVSTAASSRRQTSLISLWRRLWRRMFSET
jgi:hypothetical protein